MKKIRLFTILFSGLLILNTVPALADGATDRAAIVERLTKTCVNVLDQDKATLLTLKTKMKVDARLLKQVNSVIADFDTNYSAIVTGLANTAQEIQPLIDLCDEETEEFANSIYQLQQLAKTIATIQCVKGKTIKTVTAVKPTCPKGYTVKKSSIKA